MAPGAVQAGSLVGERLGKYDLLALLAIGGTAEIYLARIGGEAGFEKYVVVKCLLDHLADDAEFVRMFLDEARLGAQLDHSNIVQTLELGEHEGRYYLVMEHLAGMSLAQLARKTHERMEGGVIPVEIVIGLAAQGCAGLHYAHQRATSEGKQLNVVHRDVSPQNLVVTWEGILKIVDFGIAKADQRQTHTRSGTIKGKFAYMSPEQCLAEPIDRRTDVFALGTVVHELLTARRLFKRTNTYETYQAILKGNVPPPSRYNGAVDPELDKVVLRALAYHREDRYDSAEAFGEALLGWLHRRGTSVSASDVSRYVEKVCAQEIEDHAEHMRELISGRQVTGTDHLRWDVADREGSEESASLAGAPPAASAEPDSDFDEPGDTMVEPDPAGRLRALTDDFKDRPTRAEGGPSGVSARPKPVGGGHGAARPGVAAPAAPTVLEMEAPRLPGNATPSPSPGPRAMSTPPPGPRPAAGAPAERTPAPDARSPSISVYDTPAPLPLAPPGMLPAPQAAPPWSPEASEAGHALAPHRAPPSPYPMGSAAGPAPDPRVVPTWLLAVAFLAAAGVGLGITVLIGSLLA